MQVPVGQTHYPQLGTLHYTQASAAIIVNSFLNYLDENTQDMLLGLKDKACKEKKVTREQMIKTQNYIVSPNNRPKVNHARCQDPLKRRVFTF